MRLAAVILAAGVAAAAAAAAGPRLQHTSAGMTAARSILLKQTDLGKGWSAGAASSGGLQVSCPGYRPDLKGIVEIGGAGSPAFSDSSVGPFVSQTASVYGTAAQARAVWSKAIRPGLIRCVAESVLAIGKTGQGVKVTIRKQGPLALRRATPLETAYRVVATLRSAKVKYSRTVYFDVVVVGKQSTVTELTFSSLQTPVPAEVEAALAALAAHRIGLPTA